MSGKQNILAFFVIVFSACSDSHEMFWTEKFYLLQKHSAIVNGQWTYYLLHCIIL